MVNVFQDKTKNQSYILKIDKPCEQEWTSMTKSKAGKFCSHCSKTVIDFTQLADNEVLQVIERNSGKLCGLMTQEQLNRVIQLPPSTNNSGFYKILAGLLLIGVSENSLAIDNQKFQQDLTSTVDTNKGIELTEIKSEPTVDSLKNVIQGLVIDFDTKVALRFATILVKDTKIGTTTNLNGKFRIVIPDSLILDKMYLTVTCVGYENTEVEINKNDLPITKDIFIFAAPKVTILKMGVVTVVKKKKKWWQRKSKSCH